MLGVVEGIADGCADGLKDGRADGLKDGIADGSSDGPFVRLTDGSGWLFERKGSVVDSMLNQVLVECGDWTFEVVNQVGIAVRRLPNDNEMKYESSYERGDTVNCDRKQRATFGGPPYSN